MIHQIFRPETISEALSLLKRTEQLTLPLGGGTVISRLQQPDLDFSVVDLQHLGLDYLTREGNILKAGAMVTLEQFGACSDLPASITVGLRESLNQEAGANLRQMATLAGTLVSCDGRSPLVTALLALDARLIWAGEDDSQSLGDFLALRQDPLGANSRRLMTEIRIPLNTNLGFESVARSPLDRPVVCVAVGCWASGRTRIALGGAGKAPVLAMDGPEPAGASAAARDAYLHAGDAWASAEYRSDVAGVLANRLTAQCKNSPKGGAPVEDEE